MAGYWPSSFCVFMDRDGVEVHRAPPRGFREHGNCSIYFQGTGDIFKLFSGNRGTLD